jgi:hypothetical protein
LVVRTLLVQLAQGDVRYDIRTPVGLIQLSDFVARFAAELTPEVGPPFTTVVISPDNRMERLINDAFAPLKVEMIHQSLASLGIAPLAEPIYLELDLSTGVATDTYAVPSGIIAEGIPIRRPGAPEKDQVNDHTDENRSATTEDVIAD